MNSQARIVYTNRVDKRILEKEVRYLKKTKIRGQSSAKKNNLIILTRDERKYVLRELQKCLRPYWQDSLFTYSRLIDLDSSGAFFDSVREEMHNLLANSKDSAEIIRAAVKEKYAVFSFSDIIYLRNKSVFLNYCMWYDGNGGAEELYFYHKEKGLWEKWILVNAGNW